MSETSHGVKKFGEVLSYLDRAALVAEHHSAELYQLRRDTEVIDCGIYAIPYWAIENCLEVDKKVVCFVLGFRFLFQDLA